MSLSPELREQLMSGFRAETAEHIQTMTDGLLALEQQRVSGEQRQTMLEDVFRAAHSLKGAARALDIRPVEQLAHALEDLLVAIQKDTIELKPEVFTAGYRALDAIQAAQASYEAGDVEAPTAVQEALGGLEPFRAGHHDMSPVAQPVTPEVTAPIVVEQSEPDVETAVPIAVEQSETVAIAAEPVVVEQGEVAVGVAEPIAAEQSEAAVETAQEPVGDNSAQSVPVNIDQTIRVNVDKLDALMAQLSELLVTKIRAEQRLLRVREIQEFMSQWQKEWLSARAAYGQVMRRDVDASDDGSDKRASKEMSRLLDYIGNSQDRLRDMNGLINNLVREYENDTMHMSLVINALEQEIKRVRMLPLNTITRPFGRMVRDLAHAAGKEAVLHIVGGEVELDKRVLEQIKDPLIHILRNAIDHGIETPDRRAALGKPRMGTIVLRAEQSGRDVVISIADDGVGLNVEAIRRVATRRGISNAQTLDGAELSELIFTSGFSTSPIITDVSGRGMGLDVVRRNVEALSGRIDVYWTHGVGTRFTVTIPLTLTSSRALLVRTADQTFAIPFSSIETILLVNSDQVALLGGHDTLRFGGRPMTVVRLNDLLGLPRIAHGNNGPDGNQIPVIIVAASERRMAFAVDQLAGEQEIVLKDLGKQLVRVGGIAGATLMGSGEVLLVLNVADLIKLALRGDYRPIFEETGEDIVPATPRPKARILVVDDSITTRTLEKNILEAAGYIIQLAIDGQEALNAIAASGVPDLVISDVAMPRLDGFGLTQRLKSDPATANVPVILVTSLDSTEHKTRGIEVGADAYILKSSFDQTNLLETIEQLI